MKDGDISYGDVINSFLAEPQVEQEAKEILERKAEAQAVCYADGVRNPFVSLSNCSQAEHSILEQYYKQELDRALQHRGANQEISSNFQTSAPTWAAPPHVAVAQINQLLSKKSEDIGAYQLMNFVLNRIRLVSYNKVFYVFDGSIYKLCDDQDLRTLIFPFLEPALVAGKSPRIIGSVIDLLRDLPYIKVAETSESPYRIFFHNGAYNPFNHEFGPVLPNDFFTTYIPIDYIPSQMGCPHFDRYLQTVSGGDINVQQLIWEVLGYLLVPDTSAKAFFVLEGVGDTGKSVFGNLVGSFFNSESLAFLDIFRFKDRFTTSALKGKRLNICMDLPKAQISREAIGVIKMITGDDVITTEEKFKGTEPYKPTCKLLFGSNFPLMPADNDAAFRARLVKVPFRFPVAKENQDKDLLSKLKSERSAIAVKALDAYQQLKARNYIFTQVEEVFPVSGYVAESEMLEAFLSNCCVFDSSSYAYTVDLFEAYNIFRTQRHAPLLTDVSIFSRQINRFCAGRISPKRIRQGGQNLNGYMGIHLSGNFCER